MPYIEEINKKKYEAILGMLENTWKAEYRLNYSGAPIGEINYLITSILLIYLRVFTTQSYSVYNSILGVLEAIKQEFYRREVVPYENKKIRKNGDVY